MVKKGVYSDEKFQKLFDILQDMERSGRLLSVRELAEESGYKESSLRTYIGKKLKNYLLHPTKEGKYYCSGALRLDHVSFLRHMSQKSQDIDKNTGNLVTRLLTRSRDAYFLAIELYNRPTLPNKIEAFCIMMINAWELLLKANLAKSSGEKILFYKDEPARSLSLRDTVKKIYQGERDPVRKNIEFLADLRDKAIHLLIPELQSHLSRLFQASVLNYRDRYCMVANIDPSLHFGTGLISIVVDHGDLTPAVLTNVYDKNTAGEISEFLERFRGTEKDLSSHQFAIPIEYKLVLSKKVNEGDLSLTSSQDGNTALLVEVPKDIDKTHPYRQSEAVAKIKARLLDNTMLSFTPFDFQAVVFKERIKGTKSSSYYYLIARPETHRYSDSFIELILEKIWNDSSYIARCRDSYRANIRKGRK